MEKDWMSTADRTKLGVHLLIVLFGITSWSIMNGLWVELPIIVSHLPEGWSLPSYLTIICQFGNIGPILFSLLAYCTQTGNIDTPASFVIVLALTLCAVLYAFLWQQTADIGTGIFSVALLSLTLCQAFFSSTTSVAYLAFMSHFKSGYIGSIFIGMSLSGLFPAFTAIGQSPAEVRCLENTTLEKQYVNPTASSYLYLAEMKEKNTSNLPSINPQASFTSKMLTLTMTSSNQLDQVVSERNQSHPALTPLSEEPDFSVKYFFLMLASMGVVSFAALIMLVRHPYCTSELVDIHREEQSQLVKSHRDNKTKESTEPRSKAFVQKPDKTKDVTKFAEQAIPDNTSDCCVKVTELGNRTEHPDNDQTENHISTLQSWLLLGLLVWINILQTSFVLAIQVYSSLPYGLFFYNAATKAENIVDPIACVLTMWISVRSVTIVSSLTLLGTLFTAYIITVAAMSPNPFLAHETAGGILVTAAWVISTALNVFSKVSIASMMRKQGRLSLIYTGGSTQLGALIGAVLAYVMINQLHLFKDSPWC